MDNPFDKTNNPFEKGPEEGKENKPPDWILPGVITPSNDPDSNSKPLNAGDEVVKPTNLTKEEAAFGQVAKDKSKLLCPRGTKQEILAAYNNMESDIPVTHNYWKIKKNVK